MAWKLSQGAQDSSADLPLNALGTSLSVEQSTPVAQLAFDSGAIEKAYQFASGGGTSAITANRIAESSCSAAVGSQAETLTKRFAVNRAGAGIECRIEARFDTPVTGTSQIAGMIGPTDELGFGYDTSGSFGIFRNHDGVTHIHQFTLTSGSTGGTCTVTLDSSDYLTTLVSGLTEEQEAHELAASINGQTQDWQMYAIGTVLYAVAYRPYVANGTFGVSGAGVSGVAAVTRIGAAPLVDFVAQANWNIRPDANVNPENLTPYRIAAQFSGGAVVFQIADQYTGVMQSVHAIQFPSTQTAPIVRNPHFRAGVRAVNVSGSQAVTVRSTSMQLAVQGKNLFDGPSRVVINNIASDINPRNILTIKNSPALIDRSHAEVLLISAVVTSNNNESSTMYLIKNAVFAEPIEWTEYGTVADSNLLVSTNNSTVDLAQGEIIDAMTFLKDTNLIDLKEMQQYLAPNETLSFVGVENDGNHNMSASIKVFEDY